MKKLNVKLKSKTILITGYMGLSLAVLLAQHNDARLDDVADKVYTRDIFKRD